MELTSRAMDRELVKYGGGSLTLEEFRYWLLTSPATVPSQVQTAPDEQIDNLLQGLTRSELLVNQAMAEGLEIPSARQDSMAMGILTGVRNIAQQLGFFQLTLQEGEGIEDAADRVVREMLVEIVQGRQDVFPLQTVDFALKEQYGARIFQGGISRAMEIVDELRLQSGPDPLATPPATPVDTTTTDSAGAQG